MFWGLILKPDIRYKHVVEKPFRVTNACLEFKKPEDKACVKLLIKEMEFIVCYLDGKSPQKALELSFDIGEQMTLVASGNAIVHLTGFSDDEEEGMEMLESDEEASYALAPKMKRAAAETAAAVISKKQRMDRGGGDAESDDDDDEDDESFLAPVEVDDSYYDSSDEDDESGSDDEEDEDEEIESELGSEDEEDDIDMFEDVDESDEEEEEEEDVKPKKVKHEEIKKAKGKKSEPQSPVKKEQGSPKKENGVAHTNGETESAKKKKKKNKKKNKSNEGVTPAKEAQTQKHPVQTPGGKSFNVDGIMVTTIQKGNGPVAKKGRNVNVYYRGVLKTTGEEFDKTMSGKGLRFKLGKGEVIPGWDKGIEGMKVGEKRRLEIPPQHGYGNKKMGPIPPNSTLVFDVELKAVS
jgi:FK506-binding nuclear protein